MLVRLKCRIRALRWVSTSSARFFPLTEKEEQQIDRLERLDLRDAVQLLEDRSVSPSAEVLAWYLRRCGSEAAIAEGKRIHYHIVLCGFKSSRYLCNLLVEMYGKCGSLQAAKSVFHITPRRNVFSWTIMVAAFAHNGHYMDALNLLEIMDLEGISPNSITFIELLGAVAALSWLDRGRALHRRIACCGFLADIFVANCLINMYAKCRSLADACSVFESLTSRSVIAWTALVAAYALNGFFRDALKVFLLMTLDGVEPTEVTFVTVVDVCADIAVFGIGREVHGVIDARSEANVCVGNALINMYGKCASPDEARKVFDAMQRKDIITWNSMIAVYGQNGYGFQALEIYKRMQESRMTILGITHDDITFIGVLFACSHAGLVKDSCKLYSSMIGDYGFKPTSLQCGCLIDLLGRAGWLDEAEEFINSMPYHPDHTIWTILLGACITHADVERAARAADRIMALRPTDSGSYVALSNLYALAERWDDMARMRKLMDQRGVFKMAGKSSIEIGGVLHEFIAGDTSHPRKREIYEELRRIEGVIRERGYVPDIKAVLHNAAREAKEKMCCFHSERLAIAFGMISSPGGTELRIMKNLRVCPDCHSATKIISKFSGRKIIVRDANRFHEFRNGSCSCEDYW
ncbi:hypothetical protein SELMODRAFT_101455 [Selaginella moellendorffii]|uniref:DYW domain-containing protein n=1 Tax=Selaginella moellendorffii TaxID=88036 RepID=D8RTR2_SELML|nr:hypothetical protein SELMODRAFT_101455 [Selaginella moellendorffii]